MLLHAKWIAPEPPGFCSGSARCPDVQLTGEGFPPVLELPDRLGAGAALTVDEAGAEAVFLQDIVGGDDELKVPGRIRRLERRVDAAATRGVGEPDARGAIEHHGPADDRGFANEYRVIIPLFNLNRHIHHHEEPRRPWYLLEFRTAKPLGWREYFTYWFRVYVKKDLVLMHPMEKRPRITDFPT